MKRINNLAWISVLFLLFSCRKPFLFNLNEVTLTESERNVNLKNIKRIEALSEKDTLKFILVGDSQRFYDEVEEFVQQVNKVNDADFVLLAGDISDFGVAKEYKWVHQQLSKLAVPYLAVIGNHDMLANGRMVYRQMYGPEDFSFSSQGNKFICLNTNAQERGYDGSLPNIPWLKQQLTLAKGDKNVFVVSHIPPFDVGFDKRKEQEYASALVENGNVRLSLHGHLHNSQYSTPYPGGIEYAVIGSFNKRKYALVTVWDDQYKIKEVAY